MFKRQEISFEVAGESLRITPLSVTDMLKHRGAFVAMDDNDSAGALLLMCNVVIDCVTSHKLTLAELQGMDLVSLRELFDRCAELSGLRDSEKKETGNMTT
jgi:hypothetical protein